MPLDFSLINAPQIDMLGNYQRGVAASQQNAQNQMQQMDYIKGMQRKNALADILKSSGGDVQKAIPQLLQGGFTQEAAALHSLAPKPAEPFTLNAGDTRYSPTGQPIITAPQKTVEPLGKIEPKDYTKESFSAYFKTGMKDPSLLIAKPPKELLETNKPPIGYRSTAEGNLEAIPGGPADIKEQAKTSAQETGRENVSNTIASLRDYYNRLHSGGGITDPNAGTLSNLTAGASSSALGQFAGRMVGTQNQTARNEILMTRPSLLQHIMKATGMSAKQMDSNAELKLWLSTATDPTLDYASNMAALDRIEQTYGLKDSTGTKNTTSIRGASGGWEQPPDAQGGGFGDAGKESRYQAWKAQQGR